MKSLAKPEFKFNSSVWNERLNNYVERSYYSNGYYSTAESFATNIINNIIDMFSVTADDVISILSGTDNATVKKMKAKSKFLVNSCYKPAQYRDSLLYCTDSLNSRLQMLITTISTYKAHKAFVAGRRFSAFDAHGDADSVRKQYNIYLDNTDDSDWTTLREYIIEVAKTLNK